jgi:hypothetical protein
VLDPAAAARRLDDPVALERGDPQHNQVVAFDRTRSGGLPAKLKISQIPVGYGFGR